MKKEAIAAVAIIIVCGIAFYSVVKRSPVKAPSEIRPSALVGTSYVEHAQYYDIAANYASSTPLSSGANADAVASMHKFVEDAIVQFKQDGGFANLTPANVREIGLGPNRKETLQIKYLIASSPSTVSYIFTIYEDSLGAHANMTFKTFTFDTTTGKELTLADIFTAGSDYLGTLSSISRAKLPSVIGNGYDAGMIAAGTVPDDKNFSNFFFDNQDFVILFDPYAVASYANGPQTLRITVSELSGILKARYR